MTAALARAAVLPVAGAVRAPGLAFGLGGGHRRGRPASSPLRRLRAAAAALLAAVGGGPPGLGAVAQAASGAHRVRPEAVLAAFAARQARKTTRRRRRGPPTWPIPPEAVKRTPERRPDAVAALEAALGADRPFERVGRAVVALGALGGPGECEPRGARLAEGRRRTIPSCAIRLRASSAIPTNAGLGRLHPRPGAARRARRSGIRGVRETAALGLEKQGDAGGGRRAHHRRQAGARPFCPARRATGPRGRLCVAGGDRSR